MRLRARRQTLVVWSQSLGRVDPCGPAKLTHLARTRRFRRRIRILMLLTLLAMMRGARVARPRWPLLLAGTGLIVAGVILRDGPLGVLILIGFWCLLYALLISDRSDADALTSEFRDILSGQALTVCDNRTPDARR